MAFCGNCGRQLGEYESFCVDCGTAKKQTVYATSGTKIPATAAEKDNFTVVFAGLKDKKIGYGIWKATLSIIVLIVLTALILFVIESGAIQNLSRIFIISDEQFAVNAAKNAAESQGFEVLHVCKVQLSPDRSSANVRLRIYGEFVTTSIWEETMEGKPRETKIGEGGVGPIVIFDRSNFLTRAARVTWFIPNIASYSLDRFHRLACNSGDCELCRLRCDRSSCFRCNKDGNEGILGVWMQKNGWGFEFTEDGKMRRIYDGRFGGNAGARSDFYNFEIRYNYEIKRYVITHDWKEYEGILTFENDVIRVYVDAGFDIGWHIDSGWHIDELRKITP